jgi:hypothetical protein
MFACCCYLPELDEDEVASTNVGLELSDSTISASSSTVNTQSTAGVILTSSAATSSTSEIVSVGSTESPSISGSSFSGEFRAFTFSIEECFTVFFFRMKCASSQLQIAQSKRT